MQDGNYPPRNFATLGPSELRPPFTAAFYKKFFITIRITALGRCQILFLVIKHSESCVFNKQSLLSYLLYHIDSFSPEVTKLICRVPSLLLFFSSMVITKLTCVRLIQLLLNFNSYIIHNLLYKYKTGLQIVRLSLLFNL